MTKPCRVSHKPVRDRLRVAYPGYFCDGQVVGVVGRYRSKVLGMAMVEIVAVQNGRKVQVSLPAEKFVGVVKRMAA